MPLSHLLAQLKQLPLEHATESHTDSDDQDEPPGAKTTSQSLKVVDATTDEEDVMVPSWIKRRSRRVKTKSAIPLSMMADIAVDTKNHNPPECAGTFLSMTWEGGHSKKNHHKIMKELKFYCESPAMIDFCERAGLEGCKFEWNPANAAAVKRYHHPNLTKSNTNKKKQKKRLLDKLLHPRHATFYQMYEQFWNAYELSNGNEDSDDEDGDNVHSMGVVFHGTPKERVSHILHHGLDPKYRRTQAFGKGEYFAKDPGLATTYCQGGHSLIVFLVFFPPENEKYYSQRDRDILVINNLAHELPIGVLHFESVDRTVVQHTQQLRIEQKALKEQAIRKEKDLKEALAQEEQQPSVEVLQNMDQQVREAWQLYYRAKLDENRNTMEHLKTEDEVEVVVQVAANKEQDPPEPTDTATTTTTTSTTVTT